PRLSSVGLLPERRFGVALSGQAHLREPRGAAVAAKALPPLRALGGGAWGRRGDDRRGGAAVSRKRIRLCADRRGAPPRQSRQDPAGADRGAGRQLSRRGRHHTARGRLPAPRRGVSGGVYSSTETNFKRPPIPPAPWSRA